MLNFSVLRTPNKEPRKLLTDTQNALDAIPGYLKKNQDAINYYAQSNSGVNDYGMQRQGFSPSALKNEALELTISKYEAHRQAYPKSSVADQGHTNWINQMKTALTKYKTTILPYQLANDELIKQQKEYESQIKGGFSWSAPPRLRNM